jgi:hypothetical protein
LFKRKLPSDGDALAFCANTQNVLTNMLAAKVTDPNAATPYLEANNKAKTSM